jgi:hypothetical protein
MLPRKSVPAMPNSSCAIAHGNDDNGAASRGGSTRSDASRAARSLARHWMKYPG